MAARTRLLTSPCSTALSGDSGFEGTITGGKLASSISSDVAKGDVDSMVLIRTIVCPRRASSEPTRAARSAKEGSPPSSRRSASRAASSSRRTRRIPRGHASRRSASIIAPRTRRSAKVSNLIPRLASNLWAASMRPIIPSCTKSPTSIECGIDAATRRASPWTNGTPSSMRFCCSVVAICCDISNLPQATASSSGSRKCAALTSAYAVAVLYVATVVPT